MNEQLEKLAERATREALRGLGYDEANKAIRAAFRQVAELCVAEIERFHSPDCRVVADCIHAIRALVEEK